MNEQINQTPVQNTPLIQPTPPNLPDPVAKDMDKLKGILEKVKSKINKKIMIAIGITLVVFIFLLTLISVISKNLKDVVSPSNFPSPTPEEVVINPSDIASVSGELSTQQSGLQELKNEIDNLDINQSRLKPPSVNFDIKFEAKSN